VALAGAAVVVAGAAALPTIASATGSDAALLSLEAEFTAAVRTYLEAASKLHGHGEAKSSLIQAALDADPSLDGDVVRRKRAVLDACEAVDPGHRRYNTFNESVKACGRILKKIFETPARTFEGARAKLRVARTALADDELEAHQEDYGDWLDNVVGDFERLAGRVLS
jgi:hypothetical protein